MIGLDTNVLARYYVADKADAESAEQREAARRLIESGQPLKVCKTVMVGCLRYSGASEISGCQGRGLDLVEDRNTRPASVRLGTLTGAFFGGDGWISQVPGVTPVAVCGAL